MKKLASSLLCILAVGLWVAVAFADVAPPNIVSADDQQKMTIAQLQEELAQARIDVAEAKAAQSKCESGASRAAFVAKYKLGSDDKLEQLADGSVKIVRGKSAAGHSTTFTTSPVLKDSKPKK